MIRPSVIAVVMVFLLIRCVWSSYRKANDWYLFADYIDNSIVRKPLVTVKNFERLANFLTSLITNSVLTGNLKNLS